MNNYQFKRAILVIMDSVGIGAMKDAAKFGDKLSYNTLGNIAKKKKGIQLPNLESLGLGSLTRVQGVKAQVPQNGFAVKLLEKSNGKDTSTGHWEIAGIHVKEKFSYFPEGFPQEMIDRFIKENNLPGILCNQPASGTEVLKKLGEESIKTGKPIVYTSADSVFQIAAHEDHFGLEKLYALCESARKLCDEYGIIRVIARPFSGKSKKDFARTANRKDYSIAVPGKLVFDYLAEKNILTHTVGKISNIYNHQGIHSNVKSVDNNDGVNKLLELMQKEKQGLLMINLVDFDQNFGHRRDVNGYHKCLEDFDQRLVEIMQALDEDDLLILTADHGNDPTAHGTDHTREAVPMLCYSKRYQDGKILKDVSGFMGIGATIYEALTGETIAFGKSLLHKAKVSEYQDVNLFTPYTIIDKKKRKQKLSKKEITWFIEGLAKGYVADYQMTALLMAIWINGMDTEETAYLTDAMLYSGKSLDFKALNCIDKHSTGGVGDKTSFILAPIAAAAGVMVPMIAGRGLGHTGGTVDKIEAIDGFKTDISLKEFETRVREDNIAMIGQTGDIAPADKKIYSLRDVTATVDSIPLITASIMSKKLAEGTSGLVIDLKCGNGAFMKTLPDAEKLAHSLMNTAARMGKNAVSLITNMNQPLGNMIGNSLEIIESIDVLRGKGPKDIADLSIELAGAMIYLGGVTKTYSAGVAKAKEMVKSGKAFAKFKELIKNQGGNLAQVENPWSLPVATERYDVVAPSNSYIKGYETELLGFLCGDLGGGRKVATDKINFGVGFEVFKKVGDKVKKGETILTIYHDADQMEIVKNIERRILNEVLTFSTKPVKKPQLVIKRLTKWANN